MAPSSPGKRHLAWASTVWRTGKARHAKLAPQLAALWKWWARHRVVGLVGLATLLLLALRAWRQEGAPLEHGVEFRGNGAAADGQAGLGASSAEQGHEGLQLVDENDEAVAEEAPGLPVDPEADASRAADAAAAGEGAVLAAAQQREGQAALYGDPQGRPRARSLHRGVMRRRKSSWLRRIKRDPGQCWSKVEQSLYYAGRSSRAFQQKLRRYAALHAQCTKDVGDWTKFYMTKVTPRSQGDSSPTFGSEASAAASSTCKYLLWMPPLYAGLGNRILSLVTAFVYALLTDRVLLVGPGDVLATLLCNPFPSSDWMLPPSGFRTIHQNILNWQPGAAAFAERLRNGTVWDRRAAYADLKFTSGQREWRFFCEHVQRALREAKFIGLHTDEFAVPAFYLVPSFKTVLQTWFPDGRPFMHAGRYLLHPANFLWLRITRTYHAYLGHFPRRVGIQVRTFYKQDGPTAARALECAVNVSGALPPLLGRTAWETATRRGVQIPQHRAALLQDPPEEQIAVLVTSLHRHHFEYIRERYRQHGTADGTLVALHSEGHDGEELLGDEGQYEKALQEMWLLSFCDELLVSDASSFGYVAAGLAGIRPFSMNICFRPKIKLDWYSNKRPVCALASTSEPCYLAPPRSIQCPGQEEKTYPRDPAFGLRLCSNIGLGLEVPLSQRLR